MPTPRFLGPVEADETFIGGRWKNMHAHARRRRPEKIAVAGVLDRRTGHVYAEIVPKVDGRTLCTFVERAAPGAFVYTDEAAAYSDLDRHASVSHGKGQYVKGGVHTNGMESFWAILKRGYVGTYHRMSPQHLARYVTEFTGRFNQRELAPLERMAAAVRGMEGKRLPYADLVGGC